jgi:hypothetical protein
MFREAAAAFGMQLLGTLATPVVYRAKKYAWKLDPNVNLAAVDYAKLFMNGFLPDETMTTRIKELGYYWINKSPSDFQIFHKQATTLVGDAWPAKIIRLDTARFADPMTSIQRNLQLDKAIISPDQVLQLWLRGLIDFNAAKFIIMQHFNGEEAFAEHYMKLANDIPPVQDLIQFGVKDSFDPAIVERFGYNKELPSRILPYMQMQGFGGESGVAMPAGSTTVDGPDPRTKAQWFDHYWWSHWTNIAPGQVYQMGHRFYPDSRFGPSPEVLDAAGVVDPDLTTTPAVIADALKVNDYAPYWRKRLEKLSNNVLTRVDARRIFNQGLMTEAQLYHKYRAMGYNDADANFLLQWSIGERNRARFSGIKSKVMTAAQKLVKLGVYDEASFKNRLEAIGIPPEEQTLRWNQALLEQSAEALEKSLKFIRKWYLSGSLDRAGVEQLFTQLGVIRSIRERYLQIWDSEKTMGLKFIAADKAVGMYKKRLVNVAQLTNKLINLGYTGSEASLIIQEANLDMHNEAQKQLALREKENAKLRIAQTREQEKQQTKASAAAEKLANKSIKEKEKRLAKAIAPFSEKNIIAWFKGKVMNEEGVTLALTMKGWTPAAIENFKTVQLGIGVDDAGKDASNATTDQT